MFTPVCSTAAIHGRQRVGQVSDSSDAPTAHSPPMPSAARNRKIIKCHQAWAKNDRPVKVAYVRIVSISAAAAAQPVANAAENPPPSAQPTRNAA